MDHERQLESGDAVLGSLATAATAFIILTFSHLALTSSHSELTEAPHLWSARAKMKIHHLELTQLPGKMLLGRGVVGQH